MVSVAKQSAMDDDDIKLCRICFEIITNDEYYLLQTHSKECNKHLILLNILIENFVSIYLLKVTYRLDIQKF